MPVSIDKDTRSALVEAIRTYFLDECEEEIGELQAGFFLDLVLDTMGPIIYNQAVKDAQAVLYERIAELDVTLYEPERARPQTGRSS
jgi:uncharacterized protein (DUF2164 family)